MTSPKSGDGKYADFFITTHTYKTVDEHPILVDVLIPKTLIQDRRGYATNPKRPILLRYHAGWLVSLSAMIEFMASILIHVTLVNRSVGKENFRAGSRSGLSTLH